MEEKLKTRRQILWQAIKHAVADLLSIGVSGDINGSGQGKSEPKDKTN